MSEERVVNWKILVYQWRNGPSPRDQSGHHPAFTKSAQEPFIVHLFSLENCLGTSAAPPRGLPPRSDRSPWAALYTGESKRDARPPERAPPDCPLRRVAPRGDRDSPTLS